MAFNNLLIIQKPHCFVCDCVVLRKHYCHLPWCECIMISRFICQHHKLIKFLSSLCQSAMNHLSFHLHQWKYFFTCVCWCCTRCYSPLHAIIMMNRLVCIQFILKMHCAANNIVNSLSEKGHMSSNESDHCN